jgi:hypothetical protein
MMNDLITTSKRKNLICDIATHRRDDSEFYLLKGFRVIGFEANPDIPRLSCSHRFPMALRQFESKMEVDGELRAEMQRLEGHLLNVKI